MFLDRLKGAVPRAVKIELVYRAIRLRGHLDFGDRVHCNVCEHSFGRFADFNGRRNVLCPNCFSLERHRLQYEYLRRFTGIFEQPLRVLHFAPEKCLHDRIIRNRALEYHTADLMAHFIEIIETRPQHRMSVTDIAFPADHFDMVICNHVLEHIPDDRKAMAELHRVLKPGGIGICQVPIQWRSVEVLEDDTLTREQRATQYGSPDHVRLYSEPGYTARLRAAGFEVEINGLVRSLDNGRLGLMADENLYVARKPAAAAPGQLQGAELIEHDHRRRSMFDDVTLPSHPSTAEPEHRLKNSHWRRRS